MEARRRYVDKYGSPTWFDEGNLGVISPTVSGILQEIDAAIILLAIVKKHPSWTIVPAPLNFERTKYRSNVDFVLVDYEEQRAVGIQVKTSVRPWQIEKADPDRVVFVDGTKDLGNVKAMRTKHDSERKKRVAWPGMVAAGYVAQLPVNKARKVNRNMRTIAKGLAMDARVDIDEPVRVIEERILHQI